MVLTGVFALEVIDGGAEEEVGVALVGPFRALVAAEIAPCGVGQKDGCGVGVVSTYIPVAGLTLIVLETEAAGMLDGLEERFESLFPVVGCRTHLKDEVLAVLNVA